MAHELGAEIHTHLSETKGEVENIKKQYGKSPIAWFNDLGIFDVGCLAAHCVWSMTTTSTSCSKNTSASPTTLAAPETGQWLCAHRQDAEKGITVGLGTDGASSNNNLDIVEEMHLAALVHKANTLDPTVIPAETAINMLTEGGAKCLATPILASLKPAIKPTSP